jgi:SAM-dependent methyltransferase
MSEPSSDSVTVPGGNAGNALYKKDFWSEENLKYSRPHFRMEKMARLINRLSRDRERSLLDVGCGPATLASLLDPNIKYHGIDIAIQRPAPNLIEADFLETPIRFKDKKFDIVIAQGVFEYVGNFQSQKFAEIAQLVNGDGVFVVSYVNFDHRQKDVYWPYSNVQSFGDFRRSLAEHFTINRFFPTSYNWNHWEPGRRLLRAVNMPIKFNIPVVGPALTVEYFLLCSPRRAAGSQPQA